MKTQIFENYEACLKRDDLTINGVSQEFANKNPNYLTENETNKGCWNCSYCSDCYGCSDCSDCYGCYRCYGLKNVKESDSKIPMIPVIPNIHSQILEAVSKPDALNMGNWHTCDTTHCRAGWVVVLAGEEGKKLEEETSTLFAAMQIYKASSPIKVPPTRFFDSNEIAMDDMKKCAELELKEESK